jgi:hypothetical protein
MKFLLTILVTFFTTITFSQDLTIDPSKQTTQIEYNYMKFSLPEIIKKGLDVKAGYILTDLDVDDLFNGDNITVKVFSRIKNQDTTIVGALVHIDKVVPDFMSNKIVSWDICVPTTYGYGMQDFKQSLAKESSIKVLQSFSYVMSYLMSSFLSPSE